MDPPLAHMLLYAAQHGVQYEAAEMALLLQERGLGGRGEDLAARLDRWRGDRSARAEAARGMARRWSGMAGKRRTGLDPGPLALSREVAAVQPAVLAFPGTSVPLAILLAEAFPDNIARRRNASGEDWLTAGGRGLRLDPASPLARAEWLAVGEAQGEAKGARITGALALDPGDVAQWLSHRTERKASLRWIAGERRVEALLEQRLGAIIVSRGPDPAPDPEAICALLTGRVRAEGLGLLDLPPGCTNLLTRARHAVIGALAEEALLADLELWLAPLLARRLDALDPGSLHLALRDRMTFEDRQRLDQLAPAQFASPAGSAHVIDYADPAGPSVELRVQALFGLDRHPQFGDPPQPLLLHLTSPAGRPIQSTRDLPGFWRGSWRDVQREMKGRYPRHRWPNQPWLEDPSLKTRNAFERSRT